MPLLLLSLFRWPEDYREMKLSTRGKFGGLGIIINVQEGQLTIVNPIDRRESTSRAARA